MLKYYTLSPNFHLIINSVKRYRTELNLIYSSGGAYFEKENQRGMTHLLEHCRVSRTKNMTEDELDHFVFQHDIYKNASTGIMTQDTTLSGHKDYFGTMLDLILEISLTPTFSQKILDREKEIVLREIDQRQGDPNYKLWRLVNEKIYKEGSKDLYEVSGEKEFVSKTTLKDLEEIQKRVLRDSHFILSVVGGGIDIDEIAERVKPYLKMLPHDKTHAIDFNADNFLNNFKYLPVISGYAHDHCIVNVMIPCPVSLKNRAERDFLSELLFSFPTGLFYSKLRNEMGLIYSLSFFFEESTQHLIITLIGDITRAQRLLEEAVKLLSEFEDYLSEDRVQIIKNLYIKRQELSADNPFHAAEFLSNNLLGYNVPMTYREYLRQLKKITRKDIISLYDTIKEGLKDMRVVVVSKNKKVRELVKNLE